MDRSTLDQNLRPLERDRLAAWEPSDADRRRKLLVLTEKGRAKQMEAFSLCRATQERFERTVGKTEAARLRGILLGIAANRISPAQGNAGRVPGADSAMLGQRVLASKTRCIYTQGAYALPEIDRLAIEVQRAHKIFA